MKTQHFLPALLLTSFCAWGAQVVPPAPAAPSAPAATPTSAAVAAPEVEVEVQTKVREAQDQLRRAEVELERHAQTLARTEDDLRRGEGKGNVNSDRYSRGPTVTTKRAYTTAGFASSPEAPVIITPVAMEATALAELREDLTVMAKLVNDAVQSDNGDGSLRSAMGIALKWLPGGMPNNNLYVQGSGAIIQATVGFPLVSPKKEDADPAKEPVKNSAWESARRELFDNSKDKSVEVPLPPEPREEYSADRVDALKKGVLKALVNASNFRRLAADEAVTVVVRNRSGSRPSFVYFQSNDGFRNASGNAPEGDATLTIRVKKSDADALAAGKITEDEFRNRAQMALY